MAKANGVEVNKDDKVTIAAQGIKVTGTVTAVEHWGGHDGWDIEMKDANVRGGYSRWKQGTDGGKIIQVNGQVVEG